MLTPLRLISRLTVDGDLLIIAAILRMEAPAAMPREISSRSVRLSYLEDRQRTAGRMPPLADNTPCTDPACLPRALPISLSDCSDFHLCHHSAFCAEDSLGRLILAINTTLQNSY